MLDIQQSAKHLENITFQSILQNKLGSNLEYNVSPKQFISQKQPHFPLVQSQHRPRELPFNSQALIGFAWISKKGVSKQNKNNSIAQFLATNQEIQIWHQLTPLRRISFKSDHFHIPIICPRISGFLTKRTKIILPPNHFISPPTFSSLPPPTCIMAISLHPYPFTFEL